MPATPVYFGPFSGGLNTSSDPSAVEDNELTIAENFDLDSAGALIIRPPASDTGWEIDTLSSPTGLKILGFYDRPSDETRLLIASDGESTTYAINTVTGNIATITTTFSATAMVQAWVPLATGGKTVAWLLAGPDAGAPGGYYGDGVAFTPVAAMPRGDSIILHLDRLWVTCSDNKGTSWYEDALYYSNAYAQATDVGGFWNNTSATAGNFWRINPSDGQKNISLIEYGGSILVFRTRSLWQLSYTDDPADTGVVSNVLPSVGLESPECLTSYDNYLYFFYAGHAYEFASGRVQRIDDKVDLVPSGQEVASYMPFHVSTFGNRVIFGIYDILYVFNTVLRCWTTWTTQTYGTFGPFFQSEHTSGYGQRPYAYASTTTTLSAQSGTATQPVLIFYDEAGNEAEPMFATMRTKYLLYDNVSNFKRLFWWGLDCDVKLSRIETLVRNEGVLSRTTWGDLLNGTDASAPRTWGGPIESTLTSAVAAATVLPLKNINDFKDAVGAYLDVYDAKGTKLLAQAVLLTAFNASASTITIDTAVTAPKGGYVVISGQLPLANDIGGMISGGYTWSSPSHEIPQTADEVNGTSSRPARQIVKLLNSLRFRQVSFQAKITTDGASGNSAQIYRIVTFVDIKQTVSAKVT